MVEYQLWCRYRDSSTLGRTKERVRDVWVMEGFFSSPMEAYALLNELSEDINVLVIHNHKIVRVETE